MDYPSLKKWQGSLLLIMKKKINVELDIANFDNLYFDNQKLTRQLLVIQFWLVIVMLCVTIFASGNLASNFRYYKRKKKKTTIRKIPSILLLQTFSFQYFSLPNLPSSSLHERSLDPSNLIRSLTAVSVPNPKNFNFLLPIQAQNPAKHGGMNLMLRLWKKYEVFVVGRWFKRSINLNYASGFFRSP